MKVQFNAQGQAYLAPSGATVGPAPNPRPSPLAKAQAQASRAQAQLNFSIGDPPASQSPPDTTAVGSAPADPIGKFLDYDVYGGIKMKVALPVFLLLLAFAKGHQ